LKLAASLSLMRAYHLNTDADKGEPTEEPVILAWMPAASLYFHDPDGNLLELLAMLPAAPQPELGVISWRRWISSRPSDPIQPKW
jgi:lactoylglutathione lyase